MEKPRSKRWSSIIFIMVIVMALVKFLFAFAYEDVGGHIAQALMTLLGGIILLVVPAYFLGMLVDWFKKEKVSIASDVVEPDIVNRTSEKEFADKRSDAGSIDWETKSQKISEKPWLTKRLELFIALLILISIIIAVIISGIVDINKRGGSEPTPAEAPRVDPPVAPAPVPEAAPDYIQAPAPAPEAALALAPAPRVKAPVAHALQTEKEKMKERQRSADIERKNERHAIGWSAVSECISRVDEKYKNLYQNMPEMRYETIREQTDKYKAQMDEDMDKCYNLR